MNLPTIVLMPSRNASYPCVGGTYVSNTNGYVFNALVSDIPTLTGSYAGVLIAPRNTTASANPSAANDFTQLYGPGSLWVNVSTVALWMCTSMGSTPGTAVWTAVGSLAGGTPTVTLTGDVFGSGTSSISVALATVNSNVGQFESVTLNAKGLVTAATALSGYGSTSNGVLTVTKVQGRTSGANATTGDVGEVVDQVLLIPGEVSINSAANVVTLTNLAAGDWEVSGELWVDTSTGSPGGLGKMSAALTTISGSLTTGPSATTAHAFGGAPSLTSTTAAILHVGPVQVNLSGTQSVYLVGQQVVGSGTAYGYGKLHARRVS
jgi:hypothetical protein